LSEKESNEIPVHVEPEEETTAFSGNKEKEKNSDNLSLQIESEEEHKQKHKEEHKEEHKQEHKEEPEFTFDELKEQLSREKKKSSEIKFQLQHTLADFQNLERKTKSEIENGVNIKIDQFMLDFLQIYDDFVRAREAFSKNNINTEGLDSILKNMNSILSKYHVSPIDALGEIFDPKFHEAISIIEEPTLDENTITKELRKGYISHNRVIRPTLVEISKKEKSENLGG